MLPKILSTILIVFAITAAALAQAVRQAPSASYPSIQMALNASTSGDIVEVLPGTYFLTAPLNFNGRDLVLRSTAGPTNTFLTGSVEKLVVISGESALTRIEGLTFSGSVSGVDTSGVVVFGSSPVFDNCHFSANTRGIGHDSHGGALVAINSTPIVLNCVFKNNRAADGPTENIGGFFTNFGGFGGGLYAQGSIVTLKSCEFRDNKAGQGGSVSLTDCLFSGNFSGSTWQGPNLVLESRGGAIYSDSLLFSARSCVFVSNASARGGALQPRLQDT